MCGIAGVLFSDGRPVDESSIKKMTDTLAHRGPDAWGLHVSGPVGLGHRRLSIIDLSAAGKQPMCNEDETVWISYNGEIYNFLEIREELENLGHAFRSATDTEVVVHAYEEWGVDCLERFNGMFAFCIWDDTRRRLWLVRDRIGIKPVFYCKLPDRFVFGSEIKAILADDAVQRSIDYEALSYYLSLNWMPAPHTLFSGVKQLQPGHYMTVEADGTTKDYSYWDIKYTEQDSGNDAELEEKFLELLEDSVRVRLVSDVPFGAFLSGGVDSSTVAFWMSRNLDKQLKTFSIYFGESTFDENEYSSEVAKNLGSEHYLKKVTAELATVLPKIVWHSEEPTADSSMVAVYHLARETRKHVTMVHSGDGADETLAGYETYQAHYVHRLFRLLPGAARKKLLATLAKMVPASDTKVNWGFKLRQFLMGASHTSEDAHACWRMIFDPETKARLLAPVAGLPGSDADFIDVYRDYFSRTNAKHPLNRMLYVDTRLYLPNDMLVKVDRMSMAHSLEVRVPFLDHRLVEFIASIPPNLKLRNFRHKKYILKKAMEGKLPRRILWRKKQGFNVPNSRWIKNELRTFVIDHLSGTPLDDMALLDKTEVAKLLSDHFNEKRDNSHRIWCLLTLSLWWQQFVKRKP
ncbi:MAG: asparagine synthase (glutamine-hydrolyzing) [bacterium]